MNSGTFLKFAEFPERLRAPIIVNNQLELQFHFFGMGIQKQSPHVLLLDSQIFPVPPAQLPAKKRL